MIDDIVTRLMASVPDPEGMCPANTGCNAASICVCAILHDRGKLLEEAAAEITRLRDALALALDKAAEKDEG